MINMKEKNYKGIESCLTQIATLRRTLIVANDEDEETVDKFISEVGAREIERTRNMNEFQLMLEMLSQMTRSEKTLRR